MLVLVDALFDMIDQLLILASYKTNSFSFTEMFLLFFFASGG